ncbi:MAG: hypothetical protein KC543_05875 [Myxococcales bacterium]|nr:hypothetical protein [Myxococcales bacterium]
MSSVRRAAPAARGWRGGALTICAALAFVGSVAGAQQAQRAEEAPRDAAGDAPPARSLPAEGLVALVGGRTPGPGVEQILLSDVERRARIHLAGRAGAETAARAPLSAGLLHAAFEELLGEALIAHEAQRVQIGAATADDLAQARARLEETAGGAEALATLTRALGVAQAELDATVQRRAQVAAFLRANLEGTDAVTEAQIEAAYASGDHPFIGQTLDEAREALRVWLAHRAVQHAVERWVKALRARTPVRIWIDLPPAI